MRGLLYRVGAAGATIATVSILGLSSVAGATSIGFTGPWSNNTIYRNRYFNTSLVNNNNVGVTNNNNQTAYTGSASVWGNTFGGGAYTGNASNYNNAQTSINISNSSVPYWSDWNGYGGSASIYGTGPGSNNVISTNTVSSFSQLNNNNVSVVNNNSQTAVSGNAFVGGNTFGGNAVSGSATNYNSANTSINVSN